jgi:hypothetical protein
MDEAILPQISYLCNLIGIRRENLPTGESALIICDQIRANHGTLTIKELRLAFEMAAALKLDFNPHSFQNVSALYVNDLLTAYKRWSTNAYLMLRPGADRESETAQPDYSPRIYERLPVSVIRAKINHGYQNMLSGVMTNWRYIPYDWWHVCVEDGFIEYDPEADVKDNLRFNQLTDSEKRKLRNSQQMVWLLFQQAAGMKARNIYKADA